MLTTIDPPPAAEIESPTIRIGNRTLATRYFLAPLAGYTHLAFRQVVRALGGVGLATTDLVQATHLLHGTKWARKLVETNEHDQPLSVQIYGGVVKDLVAAAKWLEDRGYEAIDINMGCPMAKITGQGGGARLMCDADGACALVGAVIAAVKLPVTVKMRLGWDRERITAPALAREFEQIGVAAITIHGRTRQQGFRGSVNRDGIRAVKEAVEKIPVVGNGDVRTVADALAMRRETGCDAVAIGRGALFDPWIFRKLVAVTSAQSFNRVGNAPRGPLGTRLNDGGQRETEMQNDFAEPSADEQIDFLVQHHRLMLEHRGEIASCLMFRKFAAWYGARLGIPEDLEDRLRRFESAAEFDAIVTDIRARHGTRRDPRPTAEIKVPNGPVEYW
jgi:nifR3 family TIM-barrel protein